MVQKGFGWIPNRILSMHINIATYRPLRCGSFLPFPKAVTAEKAMVNVQNKDDQRLRWPLRAALFLVDKDRQRISKYKK